MYYSHYTVMLLHQDRLREAARRYAQSGLFYDASEVIPNESHEGLIVRIKQWMQRTNQRREQETVDVCGAPAL